MIWTSTKPTKPGYYWLRNGKCDGDLIDGPWIVLVNESLGMADISYHGTDEIDYVQEMEAEWYGPIEPPTSAIETAFNHSFPDGIVPALAEKIRPPTP